MHITVPKKAGAPAPAFARRNALQVASPCCSCASGLQLMPTEQQCWNAHHFAGLYQEEVAQS